MIFKYLINFIFIYLLYLNTNAFTFLHLDTLSILNFFPFHCEEDKKCCIQNYPQQREWLFCYRVLDVTLKRLAKGNS